MVLSPQHSIGLTSTCCTICENRRVITLHNTTYEKFSSPLKDILLITVFIERVIKSICLLFWTCQPKGLLILTLINRITSSGLAAETSCKIIIFSSRILTDLTLYFYFSLILKGLHLTPT